MNWIFSKFLKDKATNRDIRIGNQNEFGGMIFPTEPVAVTDAHVEFTSTVDFSNATITGLPDSRPYKVYTALLTQRGTDAPVVTVLESTLSDAVSWVRTDVGIYSPVGSTEILNGVLVNNQSYNFNTADEVGFILSFSGDELHTRFSVNLNRSDNLLDNTFIEIRVYD